MITNKDLQEKLKQFPDDAEITIVCFDSFGDTSYKELSQVDILMDEYGDVVIDVR